MKSYELTLRSLTPYLQHRMDDVKLADWEKMRGPIIERADISLEDHHRAEYHCYRTKEQKCYIPADHLRGALINAGSYVKSKVGSRSKSMKQIVAAMFMIEPQQILLPDWDTIDKRSCVNRSVKARVIVIRPQWTNWEVQVELVCHEDNITTETIRQIFEYAGSYVGIGSFTPRNNGQYGRFEVLDIQSVAFTKK